MDCVVVCALLAAILTVTVRGDVTNTNPRNGACLCLNANLNMRSSACGSVMVTANSGECYKFLGTKQRCSLSGTSFDFFKIDYKGTGCWGAGTYLDLSSDTRCGGDVANPRNESCVCLKDNVNMRSSACGSVMVTATSGECYKYLGSKQRCSLSETSYDFLKIDYKGTARWAAGMYLELSSDSKCDSGSSPEKVKVSSTEGYTCRIANQGKRIHETTSPTNFDCRDCDGGNTCKGGQCVAYVTCSCTRNGKHVPNTSCWKPGTSVKKLDGTCNSDILVNTSIATFKNGRFYGHAAVFMGCSDSHTIKVYDQGCGKAIGYSSFGSRHRYYGQFAVITNPGVCQDRSSWSCRTEDSGSKSCCSYTKQCSDKAKNKCV